MNTSDTGSMISPIGKRHIFAALIGIALEYYDFMIYSFFAIQIGETFFPSAGAYGSLMLSLATFGVGFIARPLGGLVIGTLADRVGRRTAMLLCLLLMGLATCLISIVPGYAAIGPAAPLAILLARLMQGFAAGGGVGPSAAFLVEAAPVHRRGLSVAAHSAAGFFGVMLGSLVGVLLSWLLTPAALQDYGWRIAFGIGVLALPGGIIIIRRVPETLKSGEVLDHGIAGSRTRLSVIRESRRTLVLGAVVSAIGPIYTYIFNYIATFAQNTLHTTARIAFEASLIGSMGSVMCILAGGWLSDRIGRRPVMIWSNVIFLLLLYPMYLWMITARSQTAILVSTLVRCIGMTPFGVFNAAFTEMLPKGIRSAAFSIIYSVMVAVFGGTCQVFITWLIHVTGNPMAPTWYLLVAVIVGQFAFWLTPESAPACLRPVDGDEAALP
jgi:MHS family citrate/tricarballylate:H+ symporter-like MFS transporter